MTETNPPRPASSVTHLRLPFCFVPKGATLPADWAAAHPGWVTFPATLRMLPDSALPPELLPLALDDDGSSAATEAAMGHGDAPRVHNAAAPLAAPRIAKPPRPLPHLPAHRAPLPVTYTDPKTLIAAFGGTATTAAGRGALIRQAQEMLDRLAQQAAARAAALAAESLAELAPPLAAGAILLRPEPAGAGEKQALRRALASLRAKGGRSFDMPPPSPPLPGLVPPSLPKRRPGEGGFRPAPPTKLNPGFTPAPPPVLVRPGRPAIENKPTVLDSRKDEPSYSGETELSRILVPGGKRIGWAEGSNKNVRTVTPQQFKELVVTLIQNAKLSSYKGYNGRVYMLPNGDLFGLRKSNRYGETIDVLRSVTTLVKNAFKVHTNEP